MLDVGCGDKPLVWDMRDAGYTGKVIRRALLCVEWYAYHLQES